MHRRRFCGLLKTPLQIWVLCLHDEVGAELFRMWPLGFAAFPVLQMSNISRISPWVSSLLMVLPPRQACLLLLFYSYALNMPMSLISWGWPLVSVLVQIINGKAHWQQNARLKILPTQCCWSAFLSYSWIAFALEVELCCFKNMCFVYFFFNGKRTEAQEAAGYNISSFSFHYAPLSKLSCYFKYHLVTISSSFSSFFLFIFF